MNPQDLSELQRKDLGYRLGVFGMLASFPASFYFSKMITQDKGNASKYLAQNFGMTIGVCTLFAYTLWQQGKTSQRLANEYLYFLNDFEIDSFAQNQSLLI